MKCIKKPFDTKEKAEAAKDYHNLLAVDKGWKTIKGVYFCEEHKAWHMTAMNTKEVKIRENWLRKQNDGGDKFIKDRDKMWDYYMEMCQNKLLVPDGRYRKPTKKSHDELMSKVAPNRKHPIMFKYIEMWWQKLPEDKKYY